MLPHRFHNQYRHNEIETSSQGKLIIMMYEGALKFVNLAIEGIDTKDLSKKGTYINKTHDIINELSCALDMNKGGDVAHKLESLYQFILHQLTLANIKSDRKALESIVNVLTPLMEAWEELLAKSNNGSANNADKNLTTLPHKKIAS
ncbi:MAG: flagellar export chaperone FliS, partial [Methylococcales bacterium]|nr:flagellar export chaperone FliS [Methylococcales bacterium]